MELKFGKPCAVHWPALVPQIEPQLSDDADGELFDRLFDLLMEFVTVDATTTLRSFIADGYVLDPARVEANKVSFITALEEMKFLAGEVDGISSSQAVDLSIEFAHTWFSLDAYDKGVLPQSGNIVQLVELKASGLYQEN